MGLNRTHYTAWWQQKAVEHSLLNSQMLELMFLSKSEKKKKPPKVLNFRSTFMKRYNPRWRIKKTVFSTKIMIKYFQVHFQRY